jgi:DNA mismatch endonuclease (patch repair protein)
MKNPEPSSEEARRRLQMIRQSRTAGEQRLVTALRALGLRCRTQIPVPGTRRKADLGFVRRKVAVFVDGCFWHVCPVHATWPKANAAWWRVKLTANRVRDRDTDRRLRKAGWTVVRFWEHENPTVAARRLARILTA